MEKFFRLKTLIPLALASVIVLLICASYYIPMLVNYGVTDTSSMSKTAEQIQKNTLKYYTEKILTLDFHYIVSIYLLYIVYYTFFAQNKRTNGKTALLLLSALIIYIYNPVFPWKYMPNFLRMIQYTFRILLFAGITTPLIIGVLLQEAFSRKQTLAQQPNNEITPLQKIKKSFIFPFKKIAWSKIAWPKIGKIACQILLIVGLLFSGVNAYYHNLDMPKSLYNNASSTTYGDNAVLPVTGHSEFYGLGAGKHGDYFPINCNRNYVSSRLQKSFFHSYNLKVSELAIYNSLSQVSFLIQKTTGGSAVLKIPYSVFEGAEVYRFSTAPQNQAIEISANKDVRDDRVRLNITDYDKESKIIISYKNAPALKDYLEDIAFGTVVLDGDVQTSNLKKQHAGKYSLDVDGSEKGGVLELPSYYYKGYRIILVDEDGAKHKIQPIHGRNGFIEVEIQQKGRLYVSFTNAYVVISYVMSAIGCLAFAGLIGYCVYKKKNENLAAEN